MAINIPRKNTQAEEIGRGIWLDNVILGLDETDNIRPVFSKVGDGVPVGEPGW